ncbi:MAG: class I SAM-dependent methyltransferase [Methylococcaceae bacterium]
MNELPNSPVEPARGINHTARRVNILGKSLNAETYLEIGVLNGDSLFSVDIKNRTGVDPHFAFDKSKVSDPNINLAEETSDRFFSMLPHSTKYDIVFIDGLHTFEQTYRDFCNSLLHSNRRTVFIIDDVRPNDVYSTLPNWEKACQMRREHNSYDGSWHGDVFKVIFALHDFHPALNYRTIIDSGNPQTLVWCSNLGWREPLFNSFEKISRLNYFDFLEHIDILRGCSEEEAISLCLAELRDDTEVEGFVSTVVDSSLPDTYSLADAVGLAFEKFNLGDVSGAKAICDQLLSSKFDNFYVYYLSGLVAWRYQHWDLAKRYLQQALGVTEGVPAERIAEASLRLKEVDAVVLLG